MFGLIKKDLLMIKGNLKAMSIMLIIFLIIALNGQEDISFFPVFISIMLAMSTFSYDEYNKWDSYAITLPGGRENIVKAKYLTAIILLSISVILTIILSLVSIYKNSTFQFDELLSTTIGVVLAITLVISMMYPVVFKLGVEKGRIGIFALIFIIVGIIGFITKKVKFRIPKIISLIFNDYYFISLPLLIVILLYISYKVSKKIYSQKEF